MRTLKERIKNDIKTLGNINIVSGKKVKEIVDYRYEFDDSFFNFGLSLDEMFYVEEKIIRYKEKINTLIEEILNDNTSRQIVLTFDQDRPLPNCTVSMQFLCRGSVLYVIIYQRSQDIEKVAMDCEIFTRIAQMFKKALSTNEHHYVCYVGNMHCYL